MQEPARVFISHHHSPTEDAFTARLAADLRNAGITVWVDVANIRDGDFMERINAALAASNWVVLVLTPASLRSPAVRTEANAAMNLAWQKRMHGIIPVVAEPIDVSDVPPTWDLLQRYDATQDYQRALAGLLSALGAPAPMPVHSAPGAPPTGVPPVGATQRQQHIPGSPTPHLPTPVPHPKRHRQFLPILLSGIGVALILSTVLVLTHLTSGPTTTNTSLPTAVLNAISHPDAHVADQVGAGTAHAVFTPLPPNTSNTGLPPQNGKPVLFSVGLEGCSYCAANQWTLAMALSRFGTFSGLKSTTSNAVGSYPNTPSVTFTSASYTSPYVALDAKEVQDATLQQLTSAEKGVFSVYDYLPYVSQDAQGALPFLNFGGQYITTGASFDLGVLRSNAADETSAPLTYEQIASGLANANSAVAQGIIGAANEYTAAICKMTNNADTAVCSDSVIATLEAKLPKR